MKKKILWCLAAASFCGIVHAADISWGSYPGDVFDGTGASDWMTGGYVYLLYVGQEGSTSLPTWDGSDWAGDWDMVGSSVPTTGDFSANSNIGQSWDAGTWADARFVFFATTMGSGEGGSASALPTDTDYFYGMSAMQGFDSYNTGSNIGEVALADDLYAITPIPEPGTMALFGLGIMTLMVRKRKRLA
jgi:hypothetical protein